MLTPVQILVVLASKLTIDRLRLRSPAINDTASSTAAPSTVVTATTISRVQLPYDPSAVLLLEILASIVLKSTDSISELWCVALSFCCHSLTSRHRLTNVVNRPITFDFLSRLLASASSFSGLFIERVVAALVRLLAVVIRHEQLRDSTFIALDILRSLPSTVLSSVAEPLMAGLSVLVTENAGQIK